MGDDMNNEPVAWVEEDNIKMIGHQFDFQFVAFNRKPKSEADWIPLYTHPAKTLTDEEIMNIAFLTTTIENDWDNTVLGFARAILKKASEK
jgi:hypothetical protein